MNATKFEDKSPYQMESRKCHHSDYRYTNHEEIRKGEYSETKRFNVALLGLGRAGSIHLQNILSNQRMSLRHVVEEDDSTIQRVKDQLCHHESMIVSSSKFDELLSDKALDGVIIATPTYTHENLVIKSLKAGKAVLCEKPISLDKERTRRCYKVAEEAGAPLLCAFNRRFEPSFAEVRRQVKDGAVGKVHMIKTCSRDSPIPPIDYVKISGGIFHDCAVHDVDLICWILDEYPEEVGATASSFIPEIKTLGDFDTVAIMMRFASGTLAMIDLSRNAVYGYDQRLEVFGPKGMLKASNERPMALSYSNQWHTSFPPIFHSFPSRYQEGYRQQLHHFCDVMGGKAEPMISAESTLKINKIASALEIAARKGQIVRVAY